MGVFKVIGLLGFSLLFSPLHTQIEKSLICSLYSVNITRQQCLLGVWQCHRSKSFSRPQSPALCVGSQTSCRSYFITCLQSRVGSVNLEAPFQISPKGLRKFLASGRADTNVSLTLCSRYYGMCETDDCAWSLWPAVVSTILLPLIWAGCRRRERGVCHRRC